MAVNGGCGWMGVEWSGRYISIILTNFVFDFDFDLFSLIYCRYCLCLPSQLTAHSF